MVDESSRPPAAGGGASPEGGDAPRDARKGHDAVEESRDEGTDDGPDDRAGGLSDLVRRAVSAGVGAARSSKEDIMRVAAGEMRTWLDHLDLENELVKALSKLVIEVKTEIRFRPTDEGKLVPEATNDVTVKPVK